MSRRLAVTVAGSLLAFTVAATVLAVVVEPGDGWSVIGESWPMIIGLSFVACGALIVSRQPGNAVGWLLCAIGALMPLGVVLAVYAVGGQARGWTGAPFAGWVNGLLWAPLITLISMPLLLLFPDGRPPGPRWRWVLWCAGVFLLLAVVGNGFSDWSVDGGRVNPYALPEHEDLLRTLRDLAVVPGLAGMVGAIASLVVRYRRADGLVRTQMRLFLTTGALLVPGIVIVDLFQDAPLARIAFPVLLSLPPVAIGLAVLRYRLYDLDRLVNRTVSYALISVVLVGVYAAGVIGFGTVVRGVAGDAGGDLVVAASTLLVAAAFGPVRRRVQTLVDRRFNRTRYDAQRTVEAFARQLRDEVDIDALSDGLRSVVQDAVQPREISVWVPASRVAGDNR